MLLAVATSVAAWSPFAMEDMVIWGGTEADPPAEADVPPNGPSPRPEPPSSAIPPEPTVPGQVFPSPDQDCAAEKAHEVVVSNKRPVRRSPNGEPSRLSGHLP